jgi:hypothetical protein
VYSNSLLGETKVSKLKVVEPFLTGDPNPNMMYTAVMPRPGMKYVWNTSGMRVEIPVSQPTRYVGNVNFKEKLPGKKIAPKRNMPGRVIAF